MKGKNPEKTIEKEPRELVRLKIVRADLSELHGLMPVFQSGRFMELKQEARQEISETPEGQFAIVKATPLLIESKKERMAAISALSGTVRSQGWLVRWSTQAKGFLLVRISDWKNTKGVSK